MRNVASRVTLGESEFPPIHLMTRISARTLLYGENAVHRQAGSGGYGCPSRDIRALPPQIPDTRLPSWRQLPHALCMSNTNTLIADFTHWHLHRRSIMHSTTTSVDKCADDTQFCGHTMVDTGGVERQGADREFARAQRSIMPYSLVAMPARAATHYSYRLQWPVESCARPPAVYCSTPRCAS